MTDQVSLPFSGTDKNALEAFFPGPNHEILRITAGLSLKGIGGVLFLHGSHSTGKSHLLQGAVKRAVEAGLVAAYIPIGARGVNHELLLQLNVRSLLCVDDVYRIAGDEMWERSLIDLYERSQSEGGRLIFSAMTPPAHIGLKLLDLSSRLGSQLVYYLSDLDDQEKAAAFGWCAHRRGIEIAPATLDWLIRHVSRDTGALFSLLDTVDNASLSENRKVTIPFLKELGLGRKDQDTR